MESSAANQLEESSLFQTHLHELTRDLANAKDQSTILNLIIERALTILGAVAGAVLLLAPDEQQFSIAALQGYKDNSSTLWQAGTYQGNVPAGEALQRQTPLYFSDHAHVLTAYPQLTERARNLPSNASAYIPMFIGDFQAGVIVIDFREPHPFPREEKQFLEILGTQCAIALERAHLLHHLESKVQERTESLARQNAELQAILNSIPDGVLVSAGHAFTRVNQPMLDMFGVNSLEELNELAPDFVNAMQLREPESLEPHELVGPRVRDGHIINQDVLFRHRKTGEDRLLRITAAPVRVGDQMVGVVAVNTDITESRQLQDLQALNTMLEKRIQVKQHELKFQQDNQFNLNRTISHDLRTPVRHVAGYAAVLRKYDAANLSQKGQQALSVIEQAAQQMNTMLDAMLLVSRSTLEPLRPTTVNLNTTLTTAIREVSREHQNPDVQWETAPLPVVQGDQDMMLLAFRELLKNALTFTRPGEPIHVRVTADEHPTYWNIHVQDNGIGFPESSAERIFDMFTKGHTKGHSSGLGIGLTLARRVAQRHGGKLTAETTPHGATFHLQLPKR